MLTLLQKRRFDLYLDLKSLAKVAEQEDVSREAIRQTLAKIPKDSPEGQQYQTIAAKEKGGRPKQYSDRKEYKRNYMRQYRAAKRSP